MLGTAVILTVKSQQDSGGPPFVWMIRAGVLVDVTRYAAGNRGYMESLLLQVGVESSRIRTVNPE
jgi:hypothetical protein